MHAHLVIGTNQAKIEEAIKELAAHTHDKIIRLQITKIEEVRNLRNLTKLKQSSPLSLVLESFQHSSEETQNALLKQIEEPQENIHFILISDSLTTILPTIISRCTTLKIPNSKHQISNEDSKIYKDLASGPFGTKFTLVSKLKSRDEAIEFVANYCHYLQSLMPMTADKLKTANTTLTRLKANSNVTLQLLNMVVNT